MVALIYRLSVTSTTWNKVPYCIFTLLSFLICRLLFCYWVKKDDGRQVRLTNWECKSDTYRRWDEKGVRRSENWVRGMREICYFLKFKTLNDTKVQARRNFFRVGWFWWWFCHRLFFFLSFFTICLPWTTLYYCHLT